jgi:hypothetical protein
MLSGGQPMPILGVRRAPLLAAFFAVFALVLLFSVRAEAQTITVAQEASLPRLTADGKDLRKRSLQFEPEGVSYQDCVDDIRIRFPLNLAGFEPQATLQLWAANTGQDCKPSTARTGTTQQCWQLGGDIPLQLTVDVIVPVREIMSGIAPLGSPTKKVSDQSICGRVELSTISLQFLYFKPAQQGTPAVSKDLSIKVDTIGPRPPSGIDVKPGNTRVLVTWDRISGDSGVTALTGVKVYCAPAESAPSSTTEASVEDAGVNCIEVPIDGADDAGDEAGLFEDGGCTPITKPGAEPQSSTSNTCSSPSFVTTEGKPKIPDDAFNKQFECGSYTGNSGTSVRAEGVGGNPLQNGKRYAIAVAGTDAFGNVGELSSVICETPQETTDFWEAYKNAGGDGGGGFCTTSGPGLPSGSLTVLVVAGALVVSAIRRRRANAKGKGQ